jgi:hypothetical protein
MSSQSSSTGRNTVKSAIATGMAGVLQFSLMHNKEVINSVKSLTQHQLQLSLSVFRLNQQVKEREGSAEYDKILIFEGYEITPAAREDLFRRLETEESYDSFNSFERRLANWITETNPYENNVKPPPPLPSPVPQNSKSMLQLGCAICLLFIGIISDRSTWYVGVAMCIIITTSYYGTIAKINEAGRVTEVDWLIPFSAKKKVEMK